MAGIGAVEGCKGSNKGTPTFDCAMCVFFWLLAREAKMWNMWEQWRGMITCGWSGVEWQTHSVVILTTMEKLMQCSASTLKTST